MKVSVWADATAQAAAIRAGEASAAELTREYLDRIDRYDGELRSYVALDADRALADARRADALVREGGDALPPFLGVTVSIKDVIDAEGLATTHSCTALADNVASADGPLVAGPRGAGLVVL
jgi:Asp-tRNA(Asn)/Glu-tRNA(Gln) amidotransferase A subunit family amidase